MTNDHGRKPEGAPERSPKAGVGAPSGVGGNSMANTGTKREIAAGAPARVELVAVMRIPMSDLI
jgi:hypothetical protein